MAAKTSTPSSPLAEELKRSGAHLAEREGWLVAADFGSLGAEIAVSRAAAGLTDVSSLGKLELHGPASSIAELHPSGSPPVVGEAFESGDVWWCALTAERMLVLSPPANAGRLQEALSRRAAPTGIEVVEVTAERAAICLTGPSSGEILASIGASDTPAGGVRAESVAGVPTVVLRRREREWLLVAPAADASALWHAVADAGAPFGLAYVGADALQHLHASPRQ